MKNIFTLAVFSLIVISWVSCDSILREEPQNKLKPSSVTDYNDLLTNGYPTSKDYGTPVILDYYTIFMSDDADIRYYNPDNDAYPLIPFSFSQAPEQSGTHEDPSMWNGYDQAWKNYYEAIYYANVVSENIDEATGEDQKRKYVKGEAMVLRAFAYFKLINLYARPYDASTADQDLGVPLKLDPVVQAESYTRSSVQEIYDQIDKDLSEGLALMQQNDVRLTTKYKFTPVAAELLASRIALYKKNYEETISRASNVIKLNPTLFGLSQNDYTSAASSFEYGQGTHYIANEDNDNVLFVYGSNPFYRYSYLPSSRSISVSDDLLNSYAEGDIRYFYFTRRGPMGMSYFKYRPYPFYVGLPVRGFRVEEAYLNRAEAYAETNQMQPAIDDLNELRKAKFDPAYYEDYTQADFTSQEALIDTVRAERRRELMFEFHRWYDLRRYGMPRLEHSYAGKTYVLEQGDPMYILQIPERELDYNPRMQKNPR